MQRHWLWCGLGDHSVKQLSVVSCQLKEVRYEEIGTASELDSQPKFSANNSGAGDGIGLAMTARAAPWTVADTITVLHSFTGTGDTVAGTARQMEQPGT